MKFPLVTRKEYMENLKIFCERISSDKEKLESYEETIKLQQELVKAIQRITEYWGHYITKIVPRECEFFIIHEPGWKPGREFYLSIVRLYGLTYNEANIETVRFGDKCIKIEEIETKSPNCGHGSILMQTLIDYAKSNHMEKIIGEISSIDRFDKYDPNHYTRLKHFYGKFGFEITDIPDSDWQNITLKLE